jgi:hypothetical protein
MRNSTEKTKEVLRGIFLTGIYLVFSSSVAFAQDMQSIVPEHAFTISPTTYYFRYEEPDVDVQVDGYMYGVVGSYAYHNKALMSISFEYSQGDLEYDGWEQPTGTPVKGDTEDWLLEWRALLGLDFPLKKHLMTPFIGIGYRQWNNDLTQMPSGYRRKITYWYSPMGVAFFGAFSDRWTYGISGEYDYLWGGEAETYLSDVLYGYPDVDLDFSQGGGYGLRGSLWVKRGLRNNVALSVEPYVTYWNIEESDREELTFYGVPTGSFVVEPPNETLTYGLLIGLEF